jgi:hypothetical protein
MLQSRIGRIPRRIVPHARPTLTAFPRRRNGGSFDAVDQQLHRLQLIERRRAPFACGAVAKDRKSCETREPKETNGGAR